MCKVQAPLKIKEASERSTTYDTCSCATWEMPENENQRLDSSPQTEVAETTHARPELDVSLTAAKHALSLFCLQYIPPFWKHKRQVFGSTLRYIVLDQL